MTRLLFRLVVAALLIGLSVTQDQRGPPRSGDSSIQEGNGPPSGTGGAPPAGDPRGERREAPGGGGGPPGAEGHGGGPPGAEGQTAGGGGPGGPPGAGHERGPFAYKPSFSAAAGFAILYLIISLITLKQLFGYKTWYFMLLPQAALGGLVGSVVRMAMVAAPKAVGMTGMMVQMIAWQLPPSLLGIILIFTFTRVVWWACPDERRTRRVLGVPPLHISMCWSAMFVIPDMAKGIVGNFAKPKEGERPDPTTLLNRVQSGCWALQFFMFAAWMLWALRFMVISRPWPTAVDAAEKRWRQLGWATVVAGVLLSWRILYGTFEFDAMYDPQSFISMHEWTLWVGAHVPVILIYMIYIVYHPGKYLPRGYTRFKFDTKKLEKEKRENPALMTRSNTSTREEAKALFEVTTTEDIGPDRRPRF